MASDKIALVSTVSIPVSADTDRRLFPLVLGLVPFMFPFMSIVSCTCTSCVCVSAGDDPNQRSSRTWLEGDLELFLLSPLVLVLVFHDLVFEFEEDADASSRLMIDD